MHTRFCTVLLVTVPQFCAPLYGNSVQPVTFADFFCDPFVRLRSKKERLRSVRRSTLTACSAEVNHFGLRFVRAHLTGVCLRSTLTACSAEVNRFGLRFVRVHLTGARLRSVRRSPKIARSAEVVNSVHLRSFRSFFLVCKQHHAARSRVRPSIAGLGCALRGRWVRPSVAGAGCSRPSQARPAPLRKGGTATAFHTAGAAVCGQSGQTLRRPDAAGLQPVRKPHTYKPDLSAILSIKAAQDGRSWHQQAQVCVTASKLLCIVPGL